MEENHNKKLIAFIRTEGTKNLDHSISTIYNSYYKSKSKNPVKYAVFKAIHDRIADLEFDILLSSKRLKLPVNLGAIQIKKKYSKILERTAEAKAYRVDWKASKILWMEKYPDVAPENLKLIKNKPLIYHKNKHTNGYVLEVKWFRGSSKVKNMYFRSFYPVRARNIQLKEFVNSREFNFVEFTVK